MTMDTFGIIGFTEDNVGIDRRIYTGSAINGETDPILPVSYNGGRVDVYLNGIKLVGDHSEMPSGTRDYTFTQTGQGSSITIRTGVALVSADVIECIGHVSGSGKTVSTYTPSVSAGDNTFNSSTTGMNGFTLAGSDLLNVYLNGVLLDSSDYTSDASADSVAITSLASGDVVHIQVIGALDYANFVPVGGGAFTGNVAVNGDLTVDTSTLKVDSSNNRVGVGIAAPVEEVHITGDDPTLLIEHTASSYGEANLKLGNDSGDNASQIQYDTTQASFYIKNLYPISAGQYGRIFFQQNVGGSLTDVLTIDNRNASINNGNLVIGSAGKGIDFSNATDVGTGESVDSSVLKDYEEGTWTPKISYVGSTNASVAGTSGGGHYIKIGNMVTLSFTYYHSGMNDTTLPSDKHAQITNLPFTSHQTAAFTAKNWVDWYFQHSSSTAVYSASVHMYNNYNRMLLYCIPSAKRDQTAGSAQITGSIVNTTASGSGVGFLIRGQITYYTDY